MKPEFWHNKWKNKELGFHQDAFNPFLVRYFDRLRLSSGDRVFVPLCGKTRDIDWLLHQGYQVVAIELVETAVQDLFANLNLSPQLTQHDELTSYQADNVTVFVGDIFNLTDAELGKVDAIYDRAAIVALPEAMRHAYTQQLIKICHNAPQLLISFDYDQNLMSGPPFAVPQALLQQYYAHHYSIEMLDSAQLQDGLKGHSDVNEQVWLLTL